MVPRACRSANEILIGYSPQGTSGLLRNPLNYFKNEVLLKKMREHFLVQALHHYATDWESPFCKHVYETEVTSVRLNLVYLHFWLLNYHMKSPIKNFDFIG